MFARPKRARSPALDVSLVAGFVLLAVVANLHYPIRHWLLTFYAQMWAWGLLFLAAALSTGWRLLRAVLPEAGPLGERLALALPLGVLVFVWGVFAGGLLGLYGRAFFVGWPIALLASTALGRAGTLASLRRAWRRLSPFGFALFAPRGPLEAAAAVLIALALVAVYLLVMTPANVGADAHWYHLAIAEHYAAAGRIRAFPEGWYLGAYPQLASLVYTWAFQAPGALAEHVALATHLEWFLFLVTLASLAPLARRLLGGLRQPYAAAALFLFPGIFLYDSSLTTMGDHVLAFWAPPLALALLRLRRFFEPREAIVAGLLTAGAVLTKYQGCFLFVPAALAVGLLAVRARRATPLAVWVVALAAASSAHWLKNFVFYGDPFYPLLHRVLADHPFHPGASALLARSYFPAQFALAGPAWRQVVDTLAALVAFSFVPHDWVAFHGVRPVFGSLFTLLLPALLFARAPRPLWELAIAVHLGLAVWFVTSHQDRFLQALLPWMAAWTAATLVHLWRTRRRTTRAAVVALVALQIVSGADVYFIRSHAMIGDAPIKAAVDHIAAGQEGRYKDRFRIWGGLQDVGRALPAAGATVLVHALTERLGLGAPAISDATGWQGGIDYLGLGGRGPSPREVATLWRRLGATHVVWRSDRGAMSPEELAREAVFDRAIAALAAGPPGPRSISGYELGALRAPAPGTARAPDDTPTRVVWLGCGGDPPTALYTPAGLAAREPTTVLEATALAQDATAALDRANAVVLRPSCPGLEAASREVGAHFQRMTEAGDVAVWIRAGD